MSGCGAVGYRSPRLSLPIQEFEFLGSTPQAEVSCNWDYLFDPSNVILSWTECTTPNTNWIYF